MRRNPPSIVLVVIQASYCKTLELQGTTLEVLRSFIMSVSGFLGSGFLGLRFQGFQVWVFIDSVSTSKALASPVKAHQNSGRPETLNHKKRTHAQTHIRTESSSWKTDRSPCNPKGSLKAAPKGSLQGTCPQARNPKLTCLYGQERRARKSRA